MRHPNLITLVFMLSGSVLPVAASAQQPDAKPNDAQVQTQSTPAQSTPVQPEHTPQQADQSRQQDQQRAEDTRINRDWTARQGSSDRADADRMRQRDEEQDNRTVGRNWRMGDDERSSRYGSMDRSEGHYRDGRPYRRVKTCVEYDNGDEFCRYLD